MAVRKAIVILAVGATMALQGCSMGSVDMFGPIRGEVEGAQSPVQLNLDELITGDWTELALVCAFTSNSAVDDLLGFHWTGGPTIDGNFDRDLLLASDGKAVVSFQEIPRDFVLCTSDSGDRFEGVRIVERRDAHLDLSLVSIEDDDPLLFGEVSGSAWVLDASTLVVTRST